MALILRRGLPVARNAFSQVLSYKSTVVKSRLHQPLGSVPPGTDADYVRSKWGSDAMEKILEIPPIEVDGDVAVCDGGGGALGHPLEYIKLTVADEDAGPQVCKYCGLRYVRKRH